MNIETPDDDVTILEASHILRCQATYVHRLIRDGRIPVSRTIKLGNKDRKLLLLRRGDVQRLHEERLAKRKAVQARREAERQAFYA